MHTAPGDCCWMFRYDKTGQLQGPLSTKQYNPKQNSLRNVISLACPLPDRMHSFSQEKYSAHWGCTKQRNFQNKAIFALLGKVIHLKRKIKKKLSLMWFMWILIHMFLPSLVTTGEGQATKMMHHIPWQKKNIFWFPQVIHGNSKGLPIPDLLSISSFLSKLIQFPWRYAWKWLSLGRHFRQSVNPEISQTIKTHFMCCEQIRSKQWERIGHVDSDMIQSFYVSSRIKTNHMKKASWNIDTI